uniref:Uncharacterized protein n=1 Tax=Panagrolaimus sp. ES5 TaxID=591445 RepID=A0AC34FU42_9BILA
MKPPPIPPRYRNYENIGIQPPQQLPSAPFRDTSSCGSDGHHDDIDRASMASYHSAPFRDTSSCGSGGRHDEFDRVSMASYHSGPGIYPSDIVIARELQNEEAAEAFSDMVQQAQSLYYARDLQMQELNNAQHRQILG